MSRPKPAPREVTRRVSRRALGQGALALAALALTHGAGPAAAAAPIAVDPLFQKFVAAVGGAAVVGAPLTPRLEREGRPAQFFERFVLEYWQEHKGTGFEVQPALLGELASGRRYFEEPLAFRSSDEVVYFSESKHSLRFGFLEFWRRHGGVDLFGFPISEEVPDAGLTAQYLQRGKLVYDPDQRPPVTIADLGRQYLEFLADGYAASYAATEIPVAKPGAVVSLTVTVTNRGQAVWPAKGEQAVTLGFRWADSFRPAVRAVPKAVGLPADAPPGAAVTLKTEVQLPNTPGPFRLQPDLRLGDQWFSGRGVRAAVLATPAQLDVPPMRVGLLDISTDNPQATKASVTSTAGLQVHDEGGVLLADLAGAQYATVHREPEINIVTLPDKSRIRTVGVVRFTPQKDSMLQLEETAPWRTYRGTLEFTYLASAASAWVINTLTLEEYLAGIAEQSGAIPWEALRASVIAYRTYAYAVRAVRRAGRLRFDAAASTHHTPTFFTRHQVYQGYAFERAAPRVAEAAAATRGMVMTYGGEPIQSVYFSRADGRTRSWHEQWGGPPKPWAMGVPDPYSVGKTLLGHGIGMPLQSCIAMGRAGANAELILRSYYSDVQFEFVY